MAGSSATREEAAPFADINVTPLVDVTLVLLIIFMVAAPLIAATPSIKVALPKATTADETRPSPLSVTLQREGSGTAIFVDGKRTTEPALRRRIPELLRQKPELQAVIAADRGIPYGDVMHVVDVVKELGVTKFAMLTEEQR
jgi:biopolymer transport protein ExbD